MAPSKTPNIALPYASTTNPPNPDYTDPSFDAVDFLNDALPPLSLQSSQSQSQSQSQSTRPVNLTELSSRVQSLLSQTNAQNVRHSTNLTSLTDEILRSGNRLAYEVEVLRGETITLSDLVTEGLAEEIEKFTTKAETKSSASTKGGEEQGKEQENEQHNEAQKEGQQEKKDEPVYVTNLRTLNQVRARLEEVVKTFGDAMEWPLPPSETSITSSFISVSAPEPGTDSHSREEKGQEVAKKLRGEITELLGGEGGVEAAMRRAEAVRTLAMVWKGTAEEKARMRFVEGLMKMVEERKRVIEAAAQSEQLAQGSHGSTRGHQRQVSEGPGGGIFRNLQRLREEIYLE
ncbi:hypothetical protein ASPVEDRAFT_51191 [Aspergillus versicolor CBS 583.65]|uniref:Uncharacterized protein n=1 Tax=Aspergillus versicolor CBS 583.65 TaxID=1036611 RepID=A0A1L9PEM7_ASPVE|nr:uncharacterized protein ASPVEDRAFT_51191 [Aspergillus versicolor CBS 583.65]OJI99894.1 hypothetical protein ASPVEDRAFT_51191 [Aspergillus versicolor CBS 583.65]